MFICWLNEGEEGKEVTEQEEIADAIRGTKVWKGDRTESTAGWLLITI